MSAYLDHAATSPMRPEVIEVVRAAMEEIGNPSSMHSPGRAARRRVEEAREDIADALGSRPSEVIFTSGGTESDNLAVKGVYRQAHDEDPTRRRLVVSSADHSAVLDSVAALAARERAEISWVAPDLDGIGHGGRRTRCAGGPVSWRPGHGRGRRGHVGQQRDRGGPAGR